MMTVKQIYDLALKMGRAADFRTQSEINYVLQTYKKQYDKLSGKRKQLFDKEKLTNPYTDTRILAGSPDTEVKRVLVGIDMDAPEVLLASDLGKDFGKTIDLVMAHHPEGKALADLGSVMHLQADMLAHYGVPINIAESVIQPRIEEVHRGISPINHTRAVDMANVLKLNMMCTHTVTDNLVVRFLERHVNKVKARTVGELLESLFDIEEYATAERTGTGPMIFNGKPENRTGKVALTDLTGGTEGNPEMYDELARAGVGTVIGMHQTEKHREASQKARINIIIAGHMSSDSLGMNILLDELEKRGVEIIPTSGLIRVSRARKKAKSKSVRVTKAAPKKKKKTAKQAVKRKVVKSKPKRKR